MFTVKRQFSNDNVICIQSCLLFFIYWLLCLLVWRIQVIAVVAGEERRRWLSFNLFTPSLYMIFNFLLTLFTAIFSPSYREASIMIKQRTIDKDNKNITNEFLQSKLSSLYSKREISNLSYCPIESIILAAFQPRGFIEKVVLIIIIICSASSSLTPSAQLVCLRNKKEKETFLSLLFIIFYLLKNRNKKRDKSF